jgi:hypothetical protein
MNLSKTHSLQIGLLLMLVGVVIFVIYVLSSPVVAILSLAVFSAAGIALLSRAAPGDS